MPAAMIVEHVTCCHCGADGAAVGAATELKIAI